MHLYHNLSSFYPTHCFLYFIRYLRCLNSRTSFVSQLISTSSAAFVILIYMCIHIFYILIFFPLFFSAREFAKSAPKITTTKKNKANPSLRSARLGFSFSFRTHTHTGIQWQTYLKIFLSQMCDIDNKPINKIVKLPSLQSKAPPRSGAPKHQAPRTATTTITYRRRLREENSRKLC